MSDTERVLYSFSGGNDGGNAATGLALDASGNLYGTTVVGGTYNCGTVFELSPQGSSWQENALYAFTCYGDGKNPHGGVTLDRGNLVGTTVAGGTGGACAGDGCGVVFQLKQSGSESTLHDFTAGNDGFGPGGAVTFDSGGHIFGTTPDGGTYSQGVIYEVMRSGRHWHEHVVHPFTGGRDGGVGSLGQLLYDSSNFYGVTELGGAHGAGTVFKLSPGSNNQWTLKTIYAFKGTPDAGYPYGGLIADASGNLYGTTYYGGAAGLGSVFELVRNQKGGYRERVLYSFKGGSDGSYTTSTLVFAGSNELYGTTSGGGASCDCGVIFKVNPKTGAETVLHAFGTGTDGAYSYYGLTKDNGGNLYGTTVAGGRNGQGTVFEFTP
jgi:uncharacterized repeat protein (TIGR03803 family)